jgi:hypothetical protein
MRILGSFKFVRQKLILRDYGYDVILFYIFVAGECLIPLFMYQSSLKADQPFNKARIVFYLVGSVVIALGLFALGIAFSHVQLSHYTIPLAMIVIINLTSIFLVILLQKGNIYSTSLLLSGGLINQQVGFITFLLFFISFLLLIIPNLLTNLWRLRMDYKQHNENLKYLRSGSVDHKNPSYVEF